MIRHLALFTAGCCLGALAVLVIRTARQHGAPPPMPANTAASEAHDHGMATEAAPSAMPAPGATSTPDAPATAQAAPPPHEHHHHEDK